MSDSSANWIAFKQWEANTRQDAFNRSKESVLSWLKGYTYCAYGQFPELDAIIDEFEEKIKKVELKDVP
jgi:hypothetical protein